MKYSIEISSVAEAEADRAFLRLSQLSSSTRANQWYSGLLQAIESLSQMPKRCPLARENDYFSQEIRQLLYGKGRNSYRILFTILEEPEISIVRILHIRHAVVPLRKGQGKEAQFREPYLVGLLKMAIILQPLRNGTTRHATQQTLGEDPDAPDSL
jgi:plasmid stabilization system protein ParE